MTLFRSAFLLSQVAVAVLLSSHLSLVLVTAGAPSIGDELTRERSNLRGQTSTSMVNAAQVPATKAAGKTAATKTAPGVKSTAAAASVKKAQPAKGSPNSAAVSKKAAATPKVAAAASKKSTAPAKSPKTPGVPKTAPGKTKTPVSKKVPASPVPKQAAPVPVPKQAAPVPQKPTPSPAPKKTVKKVTAADIKASTIRVNMFLAVLKYKGRYNRFAEYFVTHMKENVISLLPKVGLTIMVPEDAAFDKMSLEDKAVIDNNPSGWLQVTAFHVWCPSYKAVHLFDNPPGTTYSTADFPQEGIVAYKLKTPDGKTSQFSGDPNDKRGALMNFNSIYYDNNGRWDDNLLIAHGIDEVLIPSRLF